MLMTCTLRSSSPSCSALNRTPIEDAIVSVSAIPTMSSTVTPLYQNFIQCQLLAPCCLIFLGHNIIVSSWCRFRCSLLRATYPYPTTFNHITCLYAQIVIILLAVKHKERPPCRTLV